MNKIDYVYPTLHLVTN